MKIYKEKQSVFYQGQKKPINEGSLGPEQIGSDPEEKGLAMKRNAKRATSACSKLIRPNAYWAALGGAFPLTDHWYGHFWSSASGCGDLCSGAVGWKQRGSTGDLPGVWSLCGEGEGSRPL